MRGERDDEGAVMLDLISTSIVQTGPSYLPMVAWVASLM